MSNTTYPKVVIAFIAVFFLFIPSYTLAENERDNNTNPLLPSSISVSATYYDGYLANRINRLLTPEPSMWYQVGLKWESGFYFNWLEIHGTDDSDWSTDATDETQVTLGHSWKIGKIDLKTEATLINIHPIERWFDNDRYSFDMFVSRTFNFKLYGNHAVTPEFRALWFSDTQAIDKGVPIIIPSLYHTWSNPFGVDLLAIQSRIALSWDGGLYKNSSDGIFFQLETGLQWKLGKNAVVTFPGYKLFSPLTQVNDGRERTHGLFFSGVKYTF